MIRRMAFVGAGALVLLAGCATHWDVDSFEAPAGNVASRHTYFWRGGDFGTPGAVDSPAVDRAAARATTVLRPSEIQPPPASTVPRERRIREGSVLVFIDDRASGQLIWRGMVTEETRGGSTQQGVRMLTQMAHEIAREVPARAGAPQ